MVGTQGKTTTQLTPAGKARVRGKLLDVIADCEFVERGEPIEVVQVQGNRIVVRSVRDVAQ
jgi:membrane-bound serine protease (ClpP class)